MPDEPTQTRQRMAREIGAIQDARRHLPLVALLADAIPNVPVSA